MLPKILLCHGTAWAAFELLGLIQDGRRSFERNHPRHWRLQQRGLAATDERYETDSDDLTWRKGRL